MLLLPLHQVLMRLVDIGVGCIDVVFCDIEKSSLSIYESFHVLLHFESVNHPPFYHLNLLLLNLDHAFVM